MWQARPALWAVASRVGGRDGRPAGKLQAWGLSVTQIHGGMKAGDRDTPGTRVFAERDFRECAQVLVATEAAGEGINLQFCWFMINDDIPWNPVRLEQRMGRIQAIEDDLALAPKSTPVPDAAGLPDRAVIEQFLVENALQPLLAETTAQRVRETETIARHPELSLNELIHRQNLRLAKLHELLQQGDSSQPLAANLKQTDDRIDELNARLERRRTEPRQERELTAMTRTARSSASTLPRFLAASALPASSTACGWTLAPLRSAGFSPQEDWLPDGRRIAGRASDSADRPGARSCGPAANPIIVTGESELSLHKRQAERIHQTIVGSLSLVGLLVRVNRP